MARCQIGPKDCFIIFVVFFDEFDHFEQTIWPLTVLMNGVVDTSFGNRTPNQNLVQTYQQPCILRRQECFQHHLSKNYSLLSWCMWKYKLLLIIWVTKMFAKKKSTATRNFLELSWRVLNNFDSFLVDDIVFFKIRRTFECVILLFLATSRYDSSTRLLMLCNTFHTFLCCQQQRLALQFLA
jgi:hypothetical protein